MAASLFTRANSSRIYSYNCFYTIQIQTFVWVRVGYIDYNIRMQIFKITNNDPLMIQQSKETTMSLYFEVFIFINLFHLSHDILCISIN